MNWKLIRVIDAYLGIPLIWLARVLTAPRRHRVRERIQADPERILLIKFWGIGNLFMLLPAVQALHRQYPAAGIDFLTLENNYDALAMTGAVNAIATIDTATPSRFLRSCRHTLTLLRRNRYDIIVDFEQFARFSALLAHLTGARTTIGYDTRGQHRHHLYTDAIAYDNEIHITRSFYQLVANAGVTQPFSAANPLALPEKLRQNGKRLLSAAGIPPEAPAAVLHIGTSDNFRERRWSPQRYAALADLLIGHYGFRVILTGLPDEKHLIRQTLQHLKHADAVTDLSGKLSFADYFALIAVADLVISADTAAVHLASAANKPVIGLYGPNSPHLYGPWGDNGLALYADYECSPCITNFNGKINTCRHPDGRGACMEAISVQEVFTAAEKSYLLPDAPLRLEKLRRSTA